MKEKDEVQHYVLLVDGSRAYREWINTHLGRDTRFKLLYAENVEEAENLCRQYKPRCFLLGMQLNDQSGLTGIDLAFLIWREDATMILLTDYQFDQQVPPMIDAVYSKKTDPESLRRIIFNALQTGRKGFEARIQKIVSLKNLSLSHRDSLRLVSITGDVSGTEKMEGRTTYDSYGLVWVVYQPPETRSRIVISLASCVGCEGGCRFCLSGKTRPLKRQLFVSEITAQFIHSLEHSMLQGFRGQTDVNFACEGDGLLSNLDNCCEAIRMINETGIVSKFILTTIGSEANIRRLSREYPELPIEIYLSVNFADEEMRAKYMPATRTQSLLGLRDAAQEFAEKTGKLVTISWIVMKGLNDSPKDVDRLRQLFGDNRPFEIKLMALEPNSLPGVVTDVSDVRRFASWLEQVDLRHREREIIGRRIYASCGATLPVPCYDIRADI